MKYVLLSLLFAVSVHGAAPSIGGALSALSGATSGINFNNIGNFTNKIGEIILSASDDGTAFGHGISWYSVAAGNIRGNIWYNHAHPDELQLNSVKSFSFNAGLDAQRDGVIQIGTSLETDEIVTLQHNHVATNSVDRGDSKFLAFLANNGAFTRGLGFRGQTLDGAHNAQLTIYSSIKGINQTATDDTANIEVGSFGTNIFKYNSVGIGSSAFQGIAGMDGTTKGQFDVSCGSIPGMSIGADINSSSRGNGNVKVANIVFPSTTLSGTPYNILLARSNGAIFGTGVGLDIGGGTATLVNFDTVELNAGAIASPDFGCRLYCTVNGTTFNTGVGGNGSGLKHKRQTTGTVTAGTSSAVTISWGTAFADANYTVTASVVDSTAATASLLVVHIDSQTASQVVVRIQNTSAGSLTGTVNVIAIHD